MEKLLEKWVIKLNGLKWVIIIFWLILAVIGAKSYGKLPEVLSGGGWVTEGSEPIKAKDLMSEGFMGKGPATLTLVVNDSKNEVTSEKFQENLQKITDYLKKQKEIESVNTMLDIQNTGKEGFIGKDNHTSIGFIGMNVDEGYAINILPKIQKDFSNYTESIGVKAYLDGSPSFWADVSEYSKKGLGVEIFVLPLVLLVLLLVFRSVVAAVTPLLITIASVLSTMGVIYLTAKQVNLTFFITNIVIMLGLGLGIDYSLFIVDRFKHELEVCSNTKDAISKALATSGHTVFFSAITVVAAMTALFICPIPSIRSIAFGGLVVVIMVSLSSLTLLPSVLLILGKRINAGTLPFLKRKTTNKTSIWYRWSHFVMRRPVIVLILCVVLMGVCAIPAQNLKVFTPDATILPKESAFKKGYNLIKDNFGVGTAEPISITIHSENGKLTDEENVQFMLNIAEKIKGLSSVNKVQSIGQIFDGKSAKEISLSLTDYYDQLPSDAKLILGGFLNEEMNTAIIDVECSEPSASDTATELYNEIHDSIIPDSNIPVGTSVYIGGSTAEGLNVNKNVQDSLPLVLIVMLAIMYVVLLITFKSVFLPLKAIIMNLLSVAATYGILVFVFAEGHGASIFNIEVNGYIENFIPLMLVALLFSLSTDYEVFLISRMKEEYLKTGNNDNSVATGLEVTAPLISGAAFLMIAVFGGFAFSHILPIQTLGFGMAIAILLDATIVRFVLVPVTMKLLGDWNWWFPGSHKNKSKK